MMPALMKDHGQYFKDNLKIGLIVALAALVITACEGTLFQLPPPTTSVVEVMATTTVTSATDTPSPTRTPTLNSTPTPTIGSTPAMGVTPTLTSTALIPIQTLTKTFSTAAEPISVPTATPEPTPKSSVRVYETTITLPTYPIRDYLTEQVDPVYNIPVFYFDRIAFEAAAPTPTPIDYKGVVLENPYLRLTFLPELGGRLYSAMIRSTGQEIFYHNKVVKPSRYGVLQPVEANWWLATGGMEWAYPTQEHGYRWGVPWTYSVAQLADRATITLSDLAPDRVGASVEVTLLADSPVFTVAPRLINAGSTTVPSQIWLNAALSLTPDTMSPQTRFIVPVDEVTIHSRGAEGWTVPDAGMQAPWPIIGAADLGRYEEWANYLGFFIPDMDAPFMGAYNPNADLGVARLIEPGAVPGNKLFAFSLVFPDRSYTDDVSQYFEIWGGANASFWPEDDIPVPPGGELGWQERWWPLAGLGGLTWANDQAAIHLVQSGDTYTLSALVSRPTQGALIVSTGETTLLHEPFAAAPNEVLRWQFTGSDEPVQVQVVDERERVLLKYSHD